MKRCHRRLLDRSDRNASNFTLNRASAQSNCTLPKKNKRFPSCDWTGRDIEVIVVEDAHLYVAMLILNRTKQFIRRPLLETELVEDCAPRNIHLWLTSLSLANRVLPSPRNERDNEFTEHMIGMSVDHNVRVRKRSLKQFSSHRWGKIISHAWQNSSDDLLWQDWFEQMTFLVLSMKT